MNTGAHATGAAVKVDGRQSQQQAVSKRSTNSSSSSGFNHLFSSGWTRLEAMPRWMIKNTMELVVPVYNFHSKTKHHHHHHSSTVQRVLRDCDSTNAALPLDEYDVTILKQKYAKDIKADTTTQALSKQIRQLKQQLAQQRSQREKLERKQSGAREKEQKQLDQYRLKLKLALESTISSSKHRRDYSKALLRANNRKLLRTHSSGAPTSKSTAPASAILQKMKFSSYASGTASIVGMKPMTTSASSSLGPVEQEALSMETSLLRNMHRTLATQNQCDVAQKYAAELTSSLKRIRAGLDNEQAQTAMYQMILTGTERALASLYPELVALQERMIRSKTTATMIDPPNGDTCKTGRALLLLDQKQKHNNISISTLGAESSMNSSIPRVIVESQPKQHQQRQQQRQQQQQQQQGGPKSSQASTTSSVSSFSEHNTRRRSFVSTTRSDGVSDLGESLGDVVVAAAAVAGSGYKCHGSIGEEGEEEEDSIGTSTHLRNAIFVPPGGPVFASVEALQQETLQHRAATGVC